MEVRWKEMRCEREMDGVKEEKKNLRIDVRTLETIIPGKGGARS
jgi:hypothetical protein